MIQRYIDVALRRARYRKLDDGSFAATVPGLRGVIAVGSRRESCRDQLVEVIEEWILVRVARGLAVPALGGVRVRVRRAG